MYIDTGSSMPISPSKSRDLRNENNKLWRNGNDSKPKSDTDIVHMKPL